MREAILSVAAVASAGGFASADPPAGVAVGVEAGEPTAATLGWAGVRGHVGADAAIGSGIADGHGLYLALHLVAAPVALAGGRVPIYLGVGGRRYDHHFVAMSVDEIPDVELGIDARLGVGVRFGALEIVGAGGPGWDVSRTDSCTLASGVASLCPHAQSSRAFWTASLALRWWL